MPRVERRSDVIEIHWENALVYGLSGIVAGVFALIFGRYGGWTSALVLILGVITLGLLGYAAKRAIQVRQVIAYDYTCPFCQKIVQLTGIAESDFVCEHCNRLIPIVDGDVIEIHEVRCGYCNTLNYYSEKSEFLICEQCDREVPVSTSASSTSHKKLPAYYTQQDDTSLYELILLDHGPKVEELTDCLQHMLALNRHQVKQLLGELPVTLLTGISRRKAEILQAQLLLHDGEAQSKALM